MLNWVFLGGFSILVSVYYKILQNYFFSLAGTEALKLRTLQSVHVVIPVKALRYVIVGYIIKTDSTCFEKYYTFCNRQKSLLRVTYAASKCLLLFFIFYFSIKKTNNNRC